MVPRLDLADCTVAGAEFIADQARRLDDRLRLMLGGHVASLSVLDLSALELLGYRIEAVLTESKRDRG